MPISERVTLEDIAEASGTSLATVSLALRNKPGVSRTTRERVMTAARELGYERPSRVTEASADGRNVALIFRTPGSGPERAAPAVNRFYSWILTGIQEAADEAQMNLVLGSIPVDTSNNPAEMPPQRLFQNADDGVLLVGAFREETLEEVLHLASQRSTPVVLVDGSSAAHSLDSVGSMNTEGCADATRYLQGRGHTRIAFAGRRPANDPNFEARYAGYSLAMEEAGLPTRNLQLAREEVSLAEYDGQELPFTGVVCGNDHGAWMLTRELRSRGLKVPDDVSIVGFDDTDDARLATPPITTMAVDTLSMGRIAVQTLDFRLSWPEAAQVTTLLRPRLVERQSVRDVRDRD